MKKNNLELHNSGWKRRVSLVLIFTLLLSTFMHPGWYNPKDSSAAPTSNGRIFYSINTTAPQNRAYTASSNSFGAQTATQTGANPAFMVNKSAPTRNENIAGYVTTGGVLYIYRWNGTAWINETSAGNGWGATVTVGGNGVNGRRFDIAYETTSGDAMVVYSTNVTTSGGTKLAYRTWNGTTWSAATNITTARSNQTSAMTWVKLKSNPVAGSNEIALIACDQGTTAGNNALMTGLIWNGTNTWTEAGTAFTAVTTPGYIPSSTTPAVQNDLMDLAYESVSGDLLVVYTTTTPQQYYRTYSGGTWGTPTSYGTGRAAPLQMVAESDPNSNQILVMWSRQEVAPARVYGNVWTGTAVGTSTTLAGATANGIQPAINKKTISAKWLVLGGTSYGIGMWATSTAGTVGYNYFTGGAWQATGFTYATGVASALQWMDADVDPFGSDTLMLTYSNALSDLYAKRLVLTAGPTFTWTDANGGAAISATLSTTGGITTQNFDFEYDQKFPCNAVTPTGLAAGTLTPTSVPLTWTDNAANSYYRVYRDGIQISTDGAVTTGSYTDNTASVDGIYSYTVSGYDTGNTCESTQSTAVNVNTPAVTPVAPTVANPQLTTLDVTINTETPANPTSVTYAIRINGGAYTNQYVQAGGTIGASAVWQTKAAWGTKTVTGLANGTNYTFDVQARNTPLTTTSFGPTANRTTSVPCIASQVTGLAAAAGTTTTSINLTWTSPTSNVNYYNVYRDGVKVSTDGAVTTGSFTDSGPLTPSTTYSYYIKGYNNANSCEGNTASSTINKSTLAVTPGAPVTSNVGNGTSANVTIGSDSNSAGASYAIRINGGAFTNQFVQAGGSVGASAVWQTKAAWSTITVTGLTNNTNYTFDVEARNGNGENIISSPAFGGQTVQNVHVSAPSSITSCSGCHAYPPGDGTRSGLTGSVAGSHQPHNKPAYPCSTCHVPPAAETAQYFGHRDGDITMQSAIQGGAYTGGTHPQTNSPSLTSCSTNNCHGGATGNTPTPVWGSGTKPQCIVCHNGVVAALNASAVSGGAVTQRAAVKGEFGLTWGHKSGANGTKTARTPVTDSDCIVCHLEGNFTTQQTSSYHADGYIDLRDPDGSGEARITDISGAPYSFVTFSTSYAAGSKTQNGQLSNTVDNILTQKFCLACHDSNGAVNTTARTKNTGGTVTGTQYMPFEGISLGANYTAANGSAAGAGAPASGALVDVKTMLATTNSSYHPVLGPLNRDFPSAARLVAPYNNNGSRPGTSGSKTNSVVLNCFDCHNATTPLTGRTIVAHGNAATLRGTVYVATPTLCTACHVSTYATTVGGHGAGSAWSNNVASDHDATVQRNCHDCHASATTKPARPVPAQDYHGFNRLAGSGTDALWPVGATETYRPFGFIRNRTNWTAASAFHRPFRSSELTTGTAGCSASIQCDTGRNMSSPAYTPGGSY